VTKERLSTICGICALLAACFFVFPKALSIVDTAVCEDRLVDVDATKRCYMSAEAGVGSADLGCSFALSLLAIWLLGRGRASRAG